MPTTHPIAQPDGVGLPPIPIKPPPSSTVPPAGTATYVVWPQPPQANGSPYPRLDVQGRVNGSYSNVAITSPVPNLVITYVGNSGDGFGNKVIGVDPRTGMTLQFGHFNSISVKPGDTISLGGQLGIQGSTGHAWGPSGVMGAADGTHLDFGVWTGGGSTASGAYLGGTGKTVDPLKFLASIGQGIGSLFGTPSQGAMGYTGTGSNTLPPFPGSSSGQTSVQPQPGTGSAGNIQNVSLGSDIGAGIAAGLTSVIQQSAQTAGQSFAQGVYSGVRGSIQASFTLKGSNNVLYLNDLAYFIIGLLITLFGLWVLHGAGEKISKQVTELGKKTRKTIEEAASTAGKPTTTVEAPKPVSPPELPPIVE